MEESRKRGTIVCGIDFYATLNDARGSKSSQNTL